MRAGKIALKSQDFPFHIVADLLEAAGLEGFWLRIDEVQTTESCAL